MLIRRYELTCYQQQSLAIYNLKLLQQRHLYDENKSWLTQATAYLRPELDHLYCLVCKMRSAKWFMAYSQLMPCFCIHVVVIAIMKWRKPFLRKEKGLREILKARHKRKDGLPPKPERLIMRCKLSQCKDMTSICQEPFITCCQCLRHL